MHAPWPPAQLVHLPIHTSWLNQVEIFFSIVQRKVIKPGDFAELDALAERLLTFQDRYDATAEPSTGASVSSRSTDSSNALPSTNWPSQDPRCFGGEDH
jgi:hypothetical protein